jgi:hypothetical protein
MGSGPNLGLKRRTGDGLAGVGLGGLTTPRLGEERDTFFIGESGAAGLGFNPIAKPEIGIQAGEKQPVSPSRYKMLSKRQGLEVDR